MDRQWVEKSIASLGALTDSLQAASHPLAPKLRRIYDDITAAMAAPEATSCCQHCGKPLPEDEPGKPGRKRKFCDRRCRQAVYNAKTYRRSKEHA